MAERPLGRRFSHVYLERGDPVEDSEVIRNRISEFFYARFIGRAEDILEHLLAEIGLPIFLDLKFHDIPNTTAMAVKAAAEMGVWMVNVHCSGGLRMMAACREELDKRERDLATREALLQAAEQELDRKYQEMDAIRSEIKKLLEEQSEEEKARIASLVKIYEGMKPKEAARIFDTLDLDILVSVTSQMSERKLSPVLASMNPDRAKTLTIMLAEQKTLPTLPEEQ